MSETEKKEDPKVTLANEIMSDEGLTGKPTMNKLVEIIDDIGFDKKLIKEEYFSYKKKEAFANDIMEELGIKGKSTRIKVMRIMDMVGWDKKKIKTSLLRSTITSRIEHS